jgi:hypothetical protein
MDSNHSGGGDSGSGSGSNSGPRLRKKTYIKPRNGKLMNAADVLQALLENGNTFGAPGSNPGGFARGAFLSDGFTRWRLEQDWLSVVGASIAAQTVPAHYFKGTLSIMVQHPAWMQQLWQFQEPIKDKVNQHLGRLWVNEIKFTLNRRASTTELRNSEGPTPFYRKKLPNAGGEPRNDE